MSKTSLVARQVRLQQWAEDIRSCNSRPTGTTVAQWCSEHGITKSVYYWRLRAVRTACLDAAGQPETERLVDPAVRDTDFVEISPLQTCGGIHAAVIRLGNATIRLDESISDAFLCRIMEAAYHAQ